ncbi:MAG TPA: recombinase family protein [Bacilli bacterium]|nr:recombinase family protein [Bacilli bacterium]
MNLKAGIYVRVSTEEQRDYGYSIDGQIRELKDYCKRKNYVIVDIYNDAGHSAKDLKRPNMERMLDDIEKSVIDVVVAIKVDRLTREGYDGHWFLKYCKENDCAIDLLYENYDINTPNGEMLYGMNVLFAQRERREIAGRTKRGMEEAVRQGKYPSRAPYGYQKDEDSTLIPDPITSLVVKDIYSMYLNGMSSAGIMDKLKYDNRYTDYFSIRPHTIIGIIKNPVYKGDLIWGHTKRKKEEILNFENHHIPLVSKEVWEKAQDQIIRNTNGGYGEKVHIFRGIIKCPKCHQPMSNYFSRKHKGKRIKLTYYLTCHNRNCEDYKKLYNTGKIERELLPLLQDLCVFSILNDNIINIPNLKGKNELLSLEKALDELVKKENNIISLFADSRLNKELLDTKISQIIKERENINNKMVKLSDEKMFRYDDDIEELFEKREQQPNYEISNIWNILTRHAKRDIIQKYVKEIEVKIDDNYEITIEKVIFYNDFLQNDLFSFSEYLIEKANERNNTFEIKGTYRESEFEEVIKIIKPKAVFDFEEIVKARTYECENQLTELEQLKGNKTLLIYAIKTDKEISNFKIVVPS